MEGPRPTTYWASLRAGRRGARGVEQEVLGLVEVARSTVKACEGRLACASGGGSRPLTPPPPPLRPPPPLLNLLLLLREGVAVVAEGAARP